MNIYHACMFHIFSHAFPHPPHLPRISTRTQRIDSDERADYRKPPPLPTRRLQHVYDTKYRLILILLLLEVHTCSSGSATLELDDFLPAHQPSLHLVYNHHHLPGTWCVFERLCDGCDDDIGYKSLSSNTHFVFRILSSLEELYTLTYV